MAPRRKRSKHGEVAAEGAHVSEAEAVAATRILPAVAAPAAAGTSTRSSRQAGDSGVSAEQASDGGSGDEAKGPGSDDEDDVDEMEEQLNEKKMTDPQGFVLGLKGCNISRHVICSLCVLAECALCP